MREKPSTGSDMIRDTYEKVASIREHFLMSQSRQKSYDNQRQRPLEFELVKGYSKRGMVKFEKRGRLSLRYIGTFEVLERIWTIAYQFALPPNLSTIHGVFHASMLQKYTLDPTHVVNWGELVVDTDRTFE